MLAITNLLNALCGSRPTLIPKRTHLPLELKTGGSLAAMDHHVQIMLYTLSERYSVDTKDGLLFYTQGEGMETMHIPRDEMKFQVDECT